MSFDADSLYALLPAVHRARDLELAQRSGAETGPLRQLVGLIAEQLLLIGADIDQLYDDQFIETCADWVIPYIGDLLGYTPIRAQGSSTIPRAEIANTIGWRRAKGTLRAIEGIARDVTGRDAVAVDYVRRLATTRNLNHPSQGAGTASLRDATAFADPAGPFDTVPHGFDMRPIAAGGRWAIPNVVCFLWPWHPWQRAAADPVPVDATRFLFSPFGTDQALLNQPALRPDPPSAPTDLPVRLRLRGALASAAASLSVLVGGTAQSFTLCSLADTGPDPNTAAWANTPTTGLVVDPERGRFAFAAAPTGAVAVTYWYPSPGLLGGGAYPRGAGFDATLSPLFEIGAGAAYATLAAVLAAPAFTGQGAIEFAASARLTATGLPAAIAVAAGEKLEIRAADGQFPTLLPGAALALTGGAGAELVLDGFIIGGAGLTIPATVGTVANGLAQVTLRHCTLIPGLGLTRAGAPLTPGAISLTNASPDTVLVLENCITGPMQLVSGSQARLSDCVIDAGSPANPAIAGLGAITSRAGSLWIYNTTVRGGLRASLLALASNTLFLGAVDIEQRQQGITRFSFVPAQYQGPRQYGCAGQANPPLFQSWQLGDPNYARLSASAPAAILTGADDGGQIGGFHGALDASIEDGVRIRLTEYTRFGLSSGVGYAHGA